MSDNKVIDQAVILAGGLGTRLGSLTKKIPKPLIKIDNKPFIEYLFFNLSRQGFRKVLILCSYKSNFFFKKYHNKQYLNLKIICLKEKNPAGTGGALLNAKNFLKNTFLLCNGDTYLDFNINNLCLAFNPKKMLALISSSYSKTANRYTDIKIDKNGLVRKFGKISKSRNFYFNTGYYVCSKKILKFLNKNCSLENDIFPKIIKKKKLYSVNNNISYKKFIDIGILRDLKKAKIFLKKIINKPAIFLDRDGVINKKLDNDYVKHTSEFEFIDGVLNALRMLDSIFGKIVVVTNQQCIGKRIIYPEDLELIHQNMLYEISYLKGRIDKIYYSPYLASENHSTRKPGIGMALQAQKDFPTIDFNKSIIVGDSLSDMEFGRNVGMKTVYISNEPKEDKRIDFNFKSLIYFAHTLTVNL